MSEKKTNQTKSEIEVVRETLLDILQHSEDDKVRVKAAEILLAIKQAGSPSIWLE